MAKIRRVLAALSATVLAPLAAVWLVRQERRILRQGAALNESQLADARTLGIEHAERVRLLSLDRVPLPDNRLVRVLAWATGVVSVDTIGLSARYGIFLRVPYHLDRRLLAHELMHTRQYERLGGVRPFLWQYIYECFAEGYDSAPLEREAEERAHALGSPEGA